MNEHSLILDPTNIPLSLYIHIPWCVKKCPYCDFNSHALPSTAPFIDYVNALLADARSQISLMGGRKIQSIFIGGGTPSLLPIEHYRTLFLRLREIIPFADDIEITLEVNPGTLEHAPFADYLTLGINRLSVGVQSFDDESLMTLGRIHRHDEALNAIKNAKQAGFIRINVDLMYGLPNQTATLAVRDIDMALSAGATHLSWYQLTIEPNTAFYRAPPDLPNDDELERIENAGRERLIQAGFSNYEVSAWVGRDDEPCRHNINYWQFGDYLAIGAGGHGKVTLRGHASHPDGIYRYAKSRLPKEYLSYDNAPKLIGFKRVADEHLPFEFMMNALRLADGRADRATH